MKVNKLILILALFTYSLTTFAQATKPTQPIAQSTNLEDVVYLKNGSILKGKIIELDMEKEVKVEIMGGSILVYPASEIEKITQEERTTLPVNDFKAWKRPRHTPTTGIYQVLTTSLMPGFDSDGFFIIGLSLKYILGYQINQHVGVGVGYGGDLYVPDMVTPVFIDFRGYLKNKSFSPYYSLGIGYGFAQNTEWRTINSKGGIYINPAVGMRMASRRKAHFVMDVGVKLQKASFDRGQGWWGDPEEIVSREEILFKRINWRLGLVF